MASRARTAIRRLIALAALAGLDALARALSGPLGFFARALFVAVALLLLLLALSWGLRWFFWRVGRRLAFSYFLIGVLPIPMVLLLGLLGAYLQAGFFAGHLYRDAVATLSGELAREAAHRLREWRAGRLPPQADADRAFAYYRAGQRAAGSSDAPAAFPQWLAAAGGTAAVDGRRDVMTPFVTRHDDVLALAVAVADGEGGVVALFAGDLEAELSRRAQLRVRLLKAEDPAKQALVRFRLGRKEIPLQLAFPGAGREVAEPATPEAAAAPAAPRPPFWDRPLIWWGELSGAPVSLADGTAVSEYVAASLNATPRQLSRHFFSSSAELDTAIWGSVLAIGGLLATIYGVALAMALSMIYTLSRAVNRLSRATAEVRAGNFAARIPVRRHDQVGDLQRSFNGMAANLEQLVATSAQKEILEKELEIARELQQSLLPGDLPEAAGVEFATVFEPSAAIGGDYFDILHLGGERLAVVIADVSGHGLPTGLRMAMLKAALTILAEEGRSAEEILCRLDRLVRAGREARTFVTTTLSMLDLAAGRLELTNAGHPPTYILRPGQVEEIELPSPPLGALGGRWGRAEIHLEPGDIVVWLSDGLIEAADRAGEPFGYARLRAALAGERASASQVRDRILAAVARHSAGRAVEDDRSLVAMRFGAPAAAQPELAAGTAPAPLVPARPSRSKTRAT